MKAVPRLRRKQHGHCWWAHGRTHIQGPGDVQFVSLRWTSASQRQKGLHIFIVFSPCRCSYFIKISICKKYRDFLMCRNWHFSQSDLRQSTSTSAWAVHPQDHIAWLLCLCLLTIQMGTLVVHSCPAKGSQQQHSPTRSAYRDQHSSGLCVLQVRPLRGHCTAAVQPILGA